MKSKYFAWRELILMTIACALLLLIGGYLFLNFFTHRPSPAPASSPSPILAPTPTTFRIEVKRFELEPVNTENKKLGADTCMTVETLTHNAPPNVQWFYCRRLVATKNGKTSVLWYDTMPGTRKNPELRRDTDFLGDGVRIDHHLFKLRDVPLERGDLTFVWDALAQPVGRKVVYEGGEKYVSLKELDRAAKRGGLRLSKRLVLREVKAR